MAKNKQEIKAKRNFDNNYNIKRMIYMVERSKLKRYLESFNEVGSLCEFCSIRGIVPSFPSP